MATIKLDPETRLAIEAVPLKLIDAVTRNDPELYASCFLEHDSVWDASKLTGDEAGFPFHGREAIKAAMTAFEESLALAVQTHYSTHIDEYTGSTAHVRYYIGEYGRKPDGEMEFGVGMYSDKYELCEDGEWRVREHVLTPVFFGSGDLTNISRETNTIAIEKPSVG